VDVQTSERELGNLDTKTVANNAAVQVYGYETESVNDKAQEKLLNTESNNDYIGGVLKAAGSVAGNSSMFGGGGDAAGGASGGDQVFSPGATGAPRSLLSGNPYIPDQ